MVAENNAEQTAQQPVVAQKDLKQVYNEVKQLLREYIVLHEEAEYDVMTSWIMYDYIYKDIGVTSYIKLHGLKGSGKTAIMEVCKLLVTKGSIVTDMTSSRIARLIQNGVEALFIDECEYTAYIESVLNAGYKQSGNTQRCDGAGYEPVEISLFCPKMMATTTDFRSPTLNDRCIEIVTTRAGRNVKSTALMTKEEKEAVEQLRKDIADCMNRKKQQIIANYIAMDNLVGRDREIGGTLASVAKEADREAALLEYFKKVQIEKEELYLESNLEYLILDALLRITTSEKRRYFVKDITTSLHKPWIEPNMVGRMLQKLGFVREPRQGRGQSYMLSKEETIEAINKNGFKEYLLPNPSASSLPSQASEQSVEGVQTSG